MDYKNSLEGGVERLLHSLYIYVPAILERVDEEGLGVVVKKDDRKVTADKVPIFSLYSGDGFGEKHALHPPEEGFMLCAKYPMRETMAEAGVLDGLSKKRHYAFQDGHFIAGPRFHGFEQGLNSPMAAYHYRHKSGAERYISETGDMRFTHPAGHEVSLSAESVEVTYERADGEEMSLTINETQAIFDGPDLYNDFATNPRVQMGVSDDGTGQLDGRIDVGDSDAHRVDTTQLNTDTDDPKTYKEVDEPATPIVDPSKTTQTQYSNPDTVSMTGAVDGGLFELRRAIPARREKDPDPAVTDPTDPAYIELPDELRQGGKIPVGYSWINTTDKVYRMWGFGQTPVDIKPL